MAPNDPPPDGDDADALRRLEERLDRASDAAERLISEAAAQSRPPPSGWQAPSGDDERSRAAPDLGALIGLLDSLRDLIPSDLQQRLIDALRELLLAIRALIDWYLERLEGHRSQPTEVEDIPISWE